ncbi:3-isopropylmalate dehydratase [Chloroflexota bacterium]
MELILKGKCWKFGDNLSNDVEILPLAAVKELGRTMEIFKDHLLINVNPEFPKKVRAGDIIVAGKRFGHGNIHIWGYHALKEIGVGLIVESIARGGLRNAVAAGIPFLPAVESITKKVSQGDELEVNFKTGEIKNLTTNELIKAEPLPQPLLEIIEAGGQQGFLEKKFAGSPS